MRLNILVIALVTEESDRISDRVEVWVGGKGGEEEGWSVFMEGVFGIRAASFTDWLNCESCCGCGHSVGSFCSRGKVEGYGRMQ